jgi:hypothetical protein
MNTPTERYLYEVSLEGTESLTLRMLFEIKRALIRASPRVYVRDVVVAVQRFSDFEDLWREKARTLYCLERSPNAFDTPYAHVVFDPNLKQAWRATSTHVFRAQPAQAREPQLWVLPPPQRTFAPEEPE